MGLSTYRKKDHSFDVTPEPQGEAGDLTELRFVVQKHEASRLHTKKNSPRKRSSNSNEGKK